MTIKTWLAETWMHVSATGILIFGLVMLVAPFLISLVANIGRPIPRDSPYGEFARHACRTAPRAVVAAAYILRRFR